MGTKRQRSSRQRAVATKLQGRLFIEQQKDWGNGFPRAYLEIAPQRERGRGRERKRVWEMCVAKAKAVTKHVRREIGRRDAATAAAAALLVAPYLTNHISPLPFIPLCLPFSFSYSLTFVVALSCTVLVRLWPHLSATIPFAPHFASHFAGSSCRASLAWQIAIKISSATKYATLKFVQPTAWLCVCVCGCACWCWWRYVWLAACVRYMHCALHFRSILFRVPSYVFGFP